MIESVSNVQYSKAAVKNERQKQAVSAAQNTFISQIAQGDSEKTAFLKAITAMTEKNNPQSDEMIYEGAPMERTQYNVSITPEGVEKWLDVITKIGPIFVSVVDWISDKINSIKNHSKQDKQPEEKPLEQPIEA